MVVQENRIALDLDMGYLLAGCPTCEAVQGCQSDVEISPPE